MLNRPFAARLQILLIGSALALLPVTPPALLADDVFGDFSAPPPKPVSKPVPKPKPKPKPRPKPRSYQKPASPAPAQRAPRPARKEEVLTWISGRKLCRDGGQACSKRAVWPMTTEIDDSYYLGIAVPAKYCSPFAVQVYIDGRYLGTTGVLRPGSEQVVGLGKLKPGNHQLVLSALGAEGGCNTGTLRDWGVDLELSNRRALQARAGALTR
jgi:hypothetical protein